jgi:hypothetical protein
MVTFIRPPSAGHVARMGGGNAYRILVGKSLEIVHLEHRKKKRWEGEIKESFKRQFVRMGDA